MVYDIGVIHKDCTVLWISTSISYSVTFSENRLR